MPGLVACLAGPDAGGSSGAARALIMIVMAFVNDVRTKSITIMKISRRLST
jgi:hypothetical protein